MSIVDRINELIANYKANIGNPSVIYVGARELNQISLSVATMSWDFHDSRKIKNEHINGYFLGLRLVEVKEDNWLELGSIA